MTKKKNIRENIKIQKMCQKAYERRQALQQCLWISPEEGSIHTAIKKVFDILAELQNQEKQIILCKVLTHIRN